MVAIMVVAAMLAAAAIMPLKWWLQRPEEMAVVAAFPNPYLDLRGQAAARRIGEILDAKGIEHLMSGSLTMGVEVPKSRLAAARKVIDAERSRNADFAAVVTTVPGEGWSGNPVQR